MSQLEKLRAQIKQLLDDRSAEQDKLDGARSTMDDVTSAAEERGDGTLTEDETKRFNEARDAAKTYRDRLGELDTKRAELVAREQEIVESEEARNAALKAAEKYGGTEPTSVRVNRDDPVYRKDAPHSFFRDLHAYRYEADPLAADRIVRHARQTQIESRSVGTAAFGEPGGLVIPQFLIDDFAPVAHEGRPFADFVGSTALPPEGMTLNVPRGETPTVVVSQTTENSAVAEQDVVVDDLAVSVRTIAGQQNISRQALDRGRSTDMMVMQDLAETYTAELDRQIINGTGANGQHMGLLNETDISTVTVTSTDAITQLRQIADAVQQIHSARFMPATVVVVHPRRWAYWVQSTDSNGRPVVTPRAHGPQNVFGIGDLTSANGVLGDVYGLPVLADPSLPTTLSSDSGGNEDAVIVTRASDLRLWEDDPLPRRVRFEETLSGQLTVKIVAWDYSAFTAGRYPTGSVVLTGSGLTTPVFGS